MGAGKISSIAHDIVRRLKVKILNNVSMKEYSNREVGGIAKELIL